MLTRFLQCDYADCYGTLLPMLRRRVFHVTCRSNVASIMAAGEISPNPLGERRSTFGSSAEAFFRLRGCVSCFDYRTASDHEIDASLWR
jgi:hypothetical protein